MAILIAIPVLSFLAIFQSAVLSRTPLLQGTPDLVLLALIAWALQEEVQSDWQWSIIGGFFMGFGSIIPLFIPIATYLVITQLVRVVRRQIWGIPILAMFTMTFIGSLLSQTVVALALSISGTPLPVLDTIRLIILPSLILNLLLAAPIYAIMKDLAEWVHPEEIEI